MEDFWNFSKRERLGIFGICLLILFGFTLSHFFSSTPVITSNTSIAFEDAVNRAIKKEAEIALNKSKRRAKSQKQYKRKFKEKVDKVAKTEVIEPQPAILAKFNPNVATKETLTSLGISPKVANTILNFRSKGGKFFKPTDLKIIYGLSETLFATLEPYIDIPKSERKARAVKVKAIKKVDLNLCSQEELMELRGIGPILSNRIINLRNSLGGFHDPAQIKEVYQLTDSTFQSLESHLFLTPIIKKINLNDIELPHMMRHPYLSRSVAGAIITFKDHEGKIENWEALEKNIKITPEELENIKQYFTIL